MFSYTQQKVQNYVCMLDQLFLNKIDLLTVPAALNHTRPNFNAARA